MEAGGLEPVSLTYSGPHYTPRVVGWAWPGVPHSPSSSMKARGRRAGIPGESTGTGGREEGRGRQVGGRPLLITLPQTWCGLRQPSVPYTTHHPSKNPLWAPQPCHPRLGTRPASTPRGSQWLRVGAAATRARGPRPEGLLGEWQELASREADSNPSPGGGFWPGDRRAWV